MNHPDEHTLELYVVGSAKTARKRRGIESHLRRCPGCSHLVQRMRDFYAAVDKEVASGPLPAFDSKRSLVRHPETVEAYDVSDNPPRSPAGRLVRLTMYPFIRRHPVATGAGTMLILGALLLAANLVTGALFKDTKPAYYHYDTSAGTLDVYNKRNERLWQKPALNLAARANNEVRNDIRFTEVTDLDGDGRNEVITALPFSGLDGDGKVNRVRVFGQGSDLLVTAATGREVSFAGRVYPLDYGSSGILIWDDSTTHKKEILANAVGFRSPSVFTRFDARGNRIGEYWHYGHLSSLNRVSLLGSRPADYAVLGGVNDASDSVGVTFPIIVVLDPGRINGTSESSVTRGFGFEKSPAEIFYIRLLESDVQLALGVKTGVHALKASSENLLSYLVIGNADEFGVEYVFSRNLELREAKPDEKFVKTHAKLVKEGRISSRFDRGYLENLKNGVRYWDGGTWRREVVMVQQ